MKVYVVTACEYWRNYRGEQGSLHSVERIFDSEDKAKRCIESFRKNGVNAQTKDTSDEPERWCRLTDRVSNDFKLDVWYNEMEVE